MINQLINYLINNQVTSNHPAVEDLNSVVIRISDDQIVVLCNTDLTGIVEFALLLSFSANCFHKLTLRENVHLIDVQIEDFEVGSNITSQLKSFSQSMIEDRPTVACVHNVIFSLSQSVITRHLRHSL